MGQWETPGASDEWFTPPHVFEAMGVRFDEDVASPPSSIKTYVPADRFISLASLDKRWTGFVWMNPPFGGRNSLEPWLERFFNHGNGVALTPDRTSAPWFRTAWERADAVMFTPKIRFLRPDGSEGKSPANGTALWASGPQGVIALSNAARAGLGIMALPIHQNQQRAAA